MLRETDYIVLSIVCLCRCAYPQGHEEGLRLQFVHTPYVPLRRELHGRVGLRGVRRRRAGAGSRRAALETRLQPVCVVHFHSHEFLGLLMSSQCPKNPV